MLQPHVVPLALLRGSWPMRLIYPSETDSMYAGRTSKVSPISRPEVMQNNFWGGELQLHVTTVLAWRHIRWLWRDKITTEETRRRHTCKNKLQSWLRNIRRWRQELL